MNAIALNSGFARQRTRGLPSVLQPIDEWSRLRTAFVALGLSVLVAVLGVRAWRMSDASRLDASRVAWAAAQAKVEEAGRISAQLPGLKARAASDRLSPEHWSSADALRAVADLAAQSGLRDAAIEPAARKGGDAKTPQPLPERVFRLRAEGSFAEIRRFLEALAGIPRLVVPDGVQIRWQAGALAIEATLRVFETLPAIPLAIAAPRANAFIVDPFGRADSAARTGDMLLVGTFVGIRRAMALLQTDGDVGGFAPGQKIGRERLGRVVPRAVELAGDDGFSRRLTLAEDSAEGRK